MLLSLCLNDAFKQTESDPRHAIKRPTLALLFLARPFTTTVSLFLDSVLEFVHLLDARQANVLVALSFPTLHCCLFQLMTIVECVRGSLSWKSTAGTRDINDIDVRETHLYITASHADIIVSVSSTPSEYDHKLALTY